MAPLSLKTMTLEELVPWSMAATKFWGGFFSTDMLFLGAEAEVAECEDEDFEERKLKRRVKRGDFGGEPIGDFGAMRGERVCIDRKRCEN